MAARRRGRLPGDARPEPQADGGARLRIAVPSKGRLREPAWALLGATGLGPAEPGERALTASCANAPVDVVFVRAGDVPEYVQDGVVDCGITGEDVVAESGRDVEVLLRLGFGACELQLAVPREDAARDVAGVRGRRIATAHPRLAARALAAAGVEAELVAVTGTVEVAPRLGLADAIVDLVSSGSTLRANGLRPLATLVSSQAVLIGRPGDTGATQRRLTTMFASVVNARASRYVMCNAPAQALDRIVAALPTDGSPSVVPLARPGVVALHALVPAAEVWHLLPTLQDLGATALLVLPVERMLP